MKKYPIEIRAERRKGQSAKKKNSPDLPRQSLVQVYFPYRNMNLTYYNDKFDLNVGDLVYVEGKLEGHRGRITHVTYSFKIKLSDYKKVISVIDTHIQGELSLAGSHFITFSETTLPVQKIKTWFKAPEDEEDYVCSHEEQTEFSLLDLSSMNISPERADRGYDYYMSNKVVYLCIDRTHGYAIVEGKETYEVEFEYLEGEISNLVCSCYCSDPCKHQFAVMLQLKETINFIKKHYKRKYQDYFATINKNVFWNITMDIKKTGTIKVNF